MSLPATFVLWIDGVGCFRIIRTTILTMGGPTSQTMLPAEHVSLLAELSRLHVTFERHDSGYLLHPHALVSVNEKAANSTNSLGMEAIIRLGEKVELGWRIPHPLSQTAVIDFRSHHRPRQRIDGLIWMDQFCELGASSSAHIQCPQLPTSSYLYFQEDQLHIKHNLESNIKHVEQNGIYSGDHLQFRYEIIDNEPHDVSPRKRLSN